MKGKAIFNRNELMSSAKSEIFLLKSLNERTPVDDDDVLQCQPAATATDTDAERDTYTRTVSWCSRLTLTKPPSWERIRGWDWDWEWCCKLVLATATATCKRLAFCNKICLNIVRPGDRQRNIYDLWLRHENAFMKISSFCRFRGQKPEMDENMENK